VFQLGCVLSTIGRSIGVVRCPVWSCGRWQESLDHGTTCDLPVSRDPALTDQACFLDR